jgi:hypothetical protein
MNKVRLLGAVCAVLFSLITMSANATLHGRLPITPGGTDFQAAYDDVLNITWVTNAGLSEVNRPWNNQVAWASGLNYLGFDDWRLASMSVTAGTPDPGFQTSIDSCTTGVACPTNELGHMFYFNMGGAGPFIDNKAGDQTIGDVTLTDVKSEVWSGTEGGSSFAWFFIFSLGIQASGVGESHNLYGWAVRSGDVVPRTLIDNGDTTIDTTSGLEWLDLTLTQGISALDVLAGYGGYIEAGWTFATVEQVCDLFGALVDDTTNCTTGAVAMPMDAANAETLVNLLGNTASAGRGAYGMFNNLGGAPGNFSLGCINDTATSCTLGGDSSWLTQIGWASGHQTVGSFLVRPTSTSALIDNGYTTIDTVSGLEWLDLTFTQGVSAQDVLAGYGGYIEAGWTFADVEEVCALFGAFGDDTTNCTSGAVAMQLDPSNATRLASLLGNTAATGRGAYGMFNNIDSFPDNFGIGCINDTATSCTMGGGSSWLTQIEWASEYTTVGSFLIRDFIEPPPTTLIDNGDTTIDTTSGLEWLDLTFTQFDYVGNSVSAQEVLHGFNGYTETGDQGTGWTFATVEQVCGLFGALGDDTTNCTTGAVAMQMNPAKSATLVNLLGYTAAIGRGAYGMFNNIDSFPDNFGIACINDTATSCTMGGAAPGSPRSNGRAAMRQSAASS